MDCRFALSFRRAAWIVVFAAGVALAPSGAGAQVKVVGVIPDPRMPDSARQAAMIGFGNRIRSPAAMALSVKQELGLSPEQVPAIEALARVEADSVGARMKRMLQSTQDNAVKRVQGGLGSTMSWTGPVDEAAIREAACEQSRASADILIGMMRDRRALGILLTADQQRRFDELQGEMMMRAMRMPMNK